MGASEPLDFSQVVKLVGKLTSLNFFPTNEEGQLAVVEVIGKMATNIDQVRKLVDAMLMNYDQWPGPKEMRACFCHFFKPADGVITYSSVHPEGIPLSPATPPTALPAPEVLALPPGSVTADSSVDAAFNIAQAAMAAKSTAFDAPTTPEEIAAAPEWLRQLEGYAPLDLAEELERLDRERRNDTGRVN